MRSLAQKANDYVEILRLAGIPVSCDATAGYFEATEIRDMISLLKVLDNPQAGHRAGHRASQRLLPRHGHRAGEDSGLRQREEQARGFPRLRRVLPGRGPGCRSEGQAEPAYSSGSNNGEVSPAGAIWPACCGGSIARADSWPSSPRCRTARPARPTCSGSTTAPSSSRASPATRASRR